MDESVYVSGADITADYAVFIDQYVGVYLAIVIRIVCDFIGVASYGFTSVFREIQPLLLLHLVVCFEYLVKFVRDFDLVFRDRCLVYFPAELGEERHPILRRFDLVILDLFFLSLNCARRCNFVFRHEQNEGYENDQRYTDDAEKAERIRS